MTTNPPPRRGPSDLRPLFLQWSDAARITYLEGRLAALSSAACWLAILTAVLGGVQVATLLLLLVR